MGQLPVGRALAGLADQVRADRGGAHRLGLYRDLLRAIATHRVADRPDRFAPRLKKRRRNHYDRTTKPRAELKRKMAKGVIMIQVPFVGRTDARKIYVSQDAERGRSGLDRFTQHQPPRSASPDESAAQALRKALGRAPSAEVLR